MQAAAGPLFGIVDGEVRSEVCPLLFGLGQGDALARCGKSAGLQPVAQQRILITLDDADAEAACAAAFVGSPVLRAWSRFGDSRRQRVPARYVDAIAPWRDGAGYRVHAVFLIVAVRRPLLGDTSKTT